MTEEVKEAIVDIPNDSKLPENDKKESSTTDSPQKKTEDEILFPELEVDGFTIRPWTLGKLRKINPHIENVFTHLKEREIKLTTDNIDNHLMDLYFAAIPEIMTILAISLDVEESTLEDTPIPQAIRLIYLVYKQNEESIKNVLSLLQLAA
jgi:hypothetical protein